MRLRTCVTTLLFAWALVSQGAAPVAAQLPATKVIVAIANKLARIAWAVLSSGKDYRHQPLQGAPA